MTPDQKKALIIGGGVLAVGVAIWLTARNSGVVAPSDASSLIGPGPGYTSFNIPPPYTPVTNPALKAVQGGCCSGNDGCFTAGGINTGNSPTSLAQLLLWYGNDYAGFGNAFAAKNVAFNVPPQTIMEQTAPPQIAPSNLPF